MSKITVSAFRWVPPFGQGVVRDLRDTDLLDEFPALAAQMAPFAEHAPA